MEFQSDTIVAIATPPGRGGVGIVRLSGPHSYPIAKQLFLTKTKPQEAWPTNCFHYGKLIHPTEGSIIDEGLVLRMKAPYSYTGEDVVEFQVHGSPVILQEIISHCIHLGVRLAAPGEFTRRAFLNGKIDLLQAEAVAELIYSQSDAEAKAARMRLDGKLSANVQKLREITISILAECEADIDFPDENLPLEKRQHILEKFDQVKTLATKVLSTYECNQRLQNGFFVVLTGPPNVGKSSLFNALLETDRAIVTEIPGTTRDALREELILGGRRVRLVDTAGLRSPGTDVVEQIGMERTQEEMKKADLICLVCSALEEMSEKEKDFWADIPANKRWFIWNKIDQRFPYDRNPESAKVFFVSALRGDGIVELKNAIRNAAIESDVIDPEGGISNDRQRALLLKYIRALDRGETSWRNEMSPEFVAFELRQAYQALSQMLGKDLDMEEVLNEVFTKFCIGK